MPIPDTRLATGTALPITMLLIPIYVVKRAGDTPENTRPATTKAAYASRQKPKLDVPDFSIDAIITDIATSVSIGTIPIRYAETTDTMLSDDSPDIAMLNAHETTIPAANRIRT